jgi:hypothetical protein
MSMDYRRQAMARAREVRLAEANAAKVSMALHHAEQVTRYLLLYCLLLTLHT